MNIISERSRKTLSRFGGLLLAKKIIESIGLSKKVSSHIPRVGFAGCSTPEQKFLSLVYGFVAGLDCMDDLGFMLNDPGFAAVAGAGFSASRCSEFLAEFDVVGLRNLQNVLIEASLSLREELFGMREFHLIVDSTKHQQFGKKQEGVEWSYEDYRCLDSLQAYDEYGFPYWMSVRPGSTHTSEGVTEVMSAVFSRLPRSLKKRFFLADSGYCNNAVFNACAQHGAKFVIAMRANMYGVILKRELNWKRASGMKFFDGRPFEYADTVYHPVGSEKTLRVVVVRALRDDHAEGLFPDKDYDYAAFATNMGMHEIDPIGVLKKYRLRANVENSVRELKNGVDLRRFQCRRLVSNNAFAIAGAFGHAILRALAALEKRDVIHFAKRLRNKLIYLPCQVVKHARETVFRFSQTHYEEVEHCLRKRLDIKLNRAAYSVPMSAPPIFGN